MGRENPVSVDIINNAWTYNPSGDDPAKYVFGKDGVTVTTPDGYTCEIPYGDTRIDAMRAFFEISKAAPLQK